MSAHHGPDLHRLRNRVRYFFSTPSRERGEVHAFARHIGRMGECAVVGGMLRDLHLGGNRAFRSDVDFVASIDDLSEFDRSMSALGAELNRFGGYSVKLSTWTVDVWPLKRTWAARHGRADVRRIDDILGTTFFDWDAILYFPASGRIATKDDWLDRVERRVIDINHEPNPNPLGNAVRAIRYACRWNARLARPLAAHVEKHVQDSGWDALVAAERRSWQTRYLDRLDPVDVIGRLKRASTGAAVAIVH